MQRPNDDLIDRLAAEFVLGTLRGPARDRFAQWAAGNVVAGRAVRQWEDRLVPLTDRVDAVTPSPRVWREISRRTVTQGGGASFASRWWQPLAIAASILVVMIGLFVAVETRRDDVAWQMASEIRDADRPSTLWRVDFDRTQRALRVTAVEPFDLPPRSVHELWALPEGANPVSLGTLPQRGERRVSLSDAQLAALEAAGQLAVSREPEGGSPTGQPTGPVLVVSARLPIV
jgi:anti-sigma-K factor RskA